MTSPLEQLLTFYILAELDIPKPTFEYRFAPPRRWRFDIAFVEKRIAVEAEGGTWTGGRHVRGSGFEKDAEKYNEAAIMGWKVLRFTKAMIESGEAIIKIKEALK